MYHVFKMFENCSKNPQSHIPPKRTEHPLDKHKVGRTDRGPFVFRVFFGVGVPGFVFLFFFLSCDPVMVLAGGWSNSTLVRDTMTKIRLEFDTSSTQNLLCVSNFCFLCRFLFFVSMCVFCVESLLFVSTSCRISVGLVSIFCFLCRISVELASNFRFMANLPPTPWKRSASISIRLNGQPRFQPS